MTDPRTAQQQPPGAKAGWLDDPRNVGRLVWAIYAVCALLLVVDVFVHKHGPFKIEYLFGFYGIVGLVAGAGLVLAAKALRAIVGRPEDYYDR